MTRQEKQRRLDDAKRLAYGLDQSASPQVVEQLANILNYNRDQLQRDIQALAQVIQEVQIDGE